MITTEKISKVIAEKLQRSGNMQAAMGKGLWVAFNEGLLEALQDQPIERTRQIRKDLKQSYKGVFEMGFNLEQFLNNIESILSNTRLSDKEKTEEVLHITTAAKTYAKECHQL